MKTRQLQFIFLAAALLATLAFCHVVPPNVGTNDETINSQTGTTSKNESETGTGTRGGGAASTGQDAGNGSRNDGSTNSNASNDAARNESQNQPRSDSGSATTSPDASTAAPAIFPPDASTPPAATPSWVFSTPELGTLVTTSEDTTASEMTPPAWAEQTEAAASFRRPDGNRYTLMVYTKGESESFEDWMQSSEIGDAYISSRRVTTANGNVGFVYTTNDYGAVPDVHIIIPTTRFVYYFHANTETFNVPEDFISFIEETEVE